MLDLTMGEKSLRRLPSLEKRPSVVTDDPEGLVILRRKTSIDPGGDLRHTDNDRRNDRVSKVESVSCDVMSGEPIRMMGYMEKRSKLFGWKKYWFVLDGHLLTYFKSKADYESLSPFEGSITLGNVSTVRPMQIKNCRGFPMQIVSRNQVYSLRCAEKSVLEEWVLALQETISMPPCISSPVWADPGAQFYRYSFASVSEWSIATSQGDISGSLSNLPKNFYLKRDKAEYFGLKQKCQSFANLPTDSGFPVPDSPNASTRSNQSAMSTRNDPKMRYSASLVQLESSAQASELKRELASKLSIGHISPSTIRGIGKEQLDKLKLKLSTESQNSKTFHSTSEDLSTKPESKFEPVDAELPAKTVPTGAEVLRPTSSLASIAEGFEPNLKRRPLTLQLSSTASDNEDVKSLKKKRGIGTLIQRIFKKEFDASSPTKRKSEREMVISGPVDLRARRGQPTVTPPTKTASSPSSPNFQSKGAPPDSSSLISELRTVQRRRSSSEEDSASLDRETPQRPPPPLLKNCDEDLNYHEKLAKFNRLSAQFNLIPQTSATSPGTNINRSSSCRVKSTQEEDDPPLLPPKKSTLGRDTKSPYSAYDTPMNNRPITGGDVEATVVDGSLTFYPEVLDRERKISLRELLAKKNSAPEIGLSDGSSTISETYQTAADFHGATAVRSESEGQILDKAENVYYSSPLSFDSEIEEMIDANSHHSEESDAENRNGEPIYSAVPVEPEPVEAIYEEIKYATQETIIQELETVQEYEEDTELYDEFVTPMSQFPATTEGVSSPPTCSEHDYDYASVRFSGMSALQKYLEEETTNDSSRTSKVLRIEGGEAAVNRLGTSLAVHKLQKLLE